MIKESGEMWLSVRDRIGPGSTPVIICQSPEHAYYLSRIEDHTWNLANVEGWVIEERALRMADAAEFFAEFGSHWPCWLAAMVRGAPLRAFIKNGRKEGWSISLDVKTDPMVNAVVDDIRNNGLIRDAIARM